MTSLQPTSTRAFKSFIARQFALPSGLAGHVVTRLLARGNARFNQWLVSELPSSVSTSRTVIELGCGPGIALEQLLTTYPDSRVVGVELGGSATAGASLPFSLNRQRLAKS